MRSVLNKLSEYIYFYISTNITSYTSKIVESLHCILNINFFLSNSACDFEKNCITKINLVSQTMKKFICHSCYTC